MRLGLEEGGTGHIGEGRMSKQWYVKYENGKISGPMPKDEAMEKATRADTR